MNGRDTVRLRHPGQGLGERLPNLARLVTKISRVERRRLKKEEGRRERGGQDGQTGKVCPVRCQVSL